MTLRQNMNNTVLGDTTESHREKTTIGEASLLACFITTPASPGVIVARTQQMLGYAPATPGTAVALAGGDDAAMLLQAKLIQNSKIHFHKLAKSLTSTFEKQVIPEMNKMNKDGTVSCTISSRQQ